MSNWAEKDGVSIRSRVSSLLSPAVHSRYTYGRCDTSTGAAVWNDLRFPFSRDRDSVWAIVRLEERLHGMQEVGGSIPPGSTRHRFGLTLIPALIRGLSPSSIHRQEIPNREGRGVS